MTSRSDSLRRARPLLGTLVEIRVPAAGPELALEAAFSAVARVHRLMSAHSPASDVARINRARPGGRFAVDPWTWAVLRRAREISEATRGLFDCCVAPRLQASGLLPRFAGETAPDPLAGYRDLELLPGSTLRLRRRLHVTLDGIAKGFAVDRAVDALRSRGVRAGAVNAGGDLRLFGPTPEPVHVRDPRNPARLLPLGRFRDVAVATSATYFADGTSPYVDPRTGSERRPQASATVIASDCATADALAKALLLDARASAGAIRALGARAILIPCAAAA
jgi:thiamine biosynthesis lipoprotein